MHAAQGDLAEIVFVRDVSEANLFIRVLTGEMFCTVCFDCLKVRVRARIRRIMAKPRAPGGLSIMTLVYLFPRYPLAVCPELTRLLKNAALSG